MNSIGILLTDHEGINEFIIIKSFKKLEKSKIKKIYFIGDNLIFPKIFLKTLKSKKFTFLNIKLNKKNYFEYLNKITEKSIELFKKNKIETIINMPINKRKFFKKKFLGYTEFFSYKIDNKKNENMLLYNKDFAVCPLTTHAQIKDIDKLISKKKIINAITNIINFYKNFLKKKIKIVVLGLNPHASGDIIGFSKDKNIIFPIIKKFNKKKINITGPVSADTAFTKTKGKVYVGMYHDQVLIPFKMINKFKGINITIGKKILRISPDHGTGVEIVNNTKIISNESFIQCINFCENYKCRKENLVKIF